jgi:hypothetical protein
MLLRNRERVLGVSATTGAFGRKAESQMHLYELKEQFWTATGQAGAKSVLHCGDSQSCGFSGPLSPQVSVQRQMLDSLGSSHSHFMIWIVLNNLYRSKN